MLSSKHRSAVVVVIAVILSSLALTVFLSVGSALSRVPTNAQSARSLAENTVIASAGPLSLRKSSVRVPLVMRASEVARGGSFAAYLSALGRERSVYLVLRGLRATKQPGVIFHVYLDVPKDEIPKLGKKDPRYVGALNFYDATEYTGVGLRTSAGARTVSFNITGLARRLHDQGLLSEETTITISASGSANPDAEPRLNAIELVIQVKPS